MDTLRILILFFISLIILQSCQKNNDNPSINCGTRLRMVSKLEKERHTTYFNSFYYNTAGNLETFIDSMWFRTDNGFYTGVAWPINRVEYDLQGRISRIIEREPLAVDGIYQLWFYNAENLVVKNIIVSELDKDTFKHIYNYDSQKRLIIDSVFDNKKKSLINYTTFFYDANDNAVEWHHYTNASGTLQNDLKAQALYDDHPNPFRTIAIYTVPYWNDNSGLSRNNLVKLTISNGTVTQNQYKYCDNGLPKSVLNTTVSAQTVVRNIQYEYD